MKYTFLFMPGYSLLLLMLSMLFCKCSDVHEPRYVNRTIAPGFVRDVPVMKDGRIKGEESPYYEYFNAEAFALQLDSLEAGYDSLQIRVWLGHSMAINRHVVILKYRNKKWNGQLVSYSRETENDKPIKKVKNISPVSGWNNLMGKLFKLNIITLPSENDLANYNGIGLDGISYVFEIATPKMYRFYYYGNPQENTNFWQAANVLQIASLLESEFDFQYRK